MLKKNINNERGYIIVESFISLLFVGVLMTSFLSLSLFICRKGQDEAEKLEMYRLLYEGSEYYRKTGHLPRWSKVSQGQKYDVAGSLSEGKLKISIVNKDGYTEVSLYELY